MSLDPNATPTTATPTPLPAPGDATNPNATATSLTTPQANATPAPASGAQPSDNSNAPDAQTPAAKSIPANLVNDPAAQTQKMATQADANKNSPSPFHTMLRHAAMEMLGGPQMRTDYKADGTAVRTPIEPSLAHLGLALAAEIVKGSLAGGNAKDSVAAAQAGQAQVAKDQAARKQANIDQDAQAKADQNHKLAVVKNNLETHQLALNVGKQDLEMNQAYVDGYKDTVSMLEKHQDLIQGDIPEEKVQEGLKSGKYNVTKNLFIPHGDPVAVLDPATGEQKKGPNGEPIWGHNYYVVDAKAKGVLTQELQDQMYKNGKLRNPDGSRVVVPTNSEYPMATIGQYAVENAQIQTAEEQLERHKNDILGDKAGPRVSMADQVAKDPAMMDAVKDYSRFIGTGAPDQVLGAMMQNGKGQSAAKLMDFMGITPDDIRNAENQRLAEHAEALASGKAEATKQPIPAAQYASIADDIKAAHPELPAARIAVLAKRVTPKSNMGDYKELMNTADKEGNALISQQDRKSAQADREVAQADARIEKGEKPVIGVDANNHQVLVPAGDVTHYGLTQVRQVGQAENEKISNARGLMTVFSNVDPDDQGLIQLATKLKDEGKLGPVASKLQNWLNKGGSVVTFDAAGDPDVQRLFTKLGLSTTGLMQVHVGARGSAQMLEHFQDLADAKKLSPQAFMAALDTENKYIRMKAMLPNQAAGTGTTAAGSNAGNAAPKVKPGFVSVQIPGQPAGSVPADKVAAFRAKYPNAVIGQ